ncbi:glycoside hydrolase family 15 protein [Halopelagius longus]|uniref:Glucan 1,4-alpha-glucosidase n=1 Tax=Halopelagius longus TaxID=1236180 RepID=A0A1H1DLA2_9EURY|nr:glycoside hydrolase family 15 protein [Halopelagius longus]SDQ77237.1 hypothetical protein SAMN05216278_2468 [Halopelagius longus]
MQLRDALNDYKRHRDHETRFPGECRTTTGRFSGLDGRLVHVDEDGRLRDFSYPLVGLTGVVRSRVGVRPAGAADSETTWFDAEGGDQRYHGDTALVVTTHETPHGVVSQYDLTLGDVHVTHVDASEADGELDVAACVGFGPDGRDTQIGQLRHGDAVEVYHAEEHDYLASATGFETLRGEAFGGFDGLAGDAPDPYPRPVSEDRYEDGQLSGDVVGVLPAPDGSATFATLLTDRSERPRADALDAVRTAAAEYADVSALERAAEAQVGDVSGPYADAVAADLRVLSLLSGPRGLRAAGPDFDPYYVYSGGYGYTWFRDDSEISLFLLESDRRFGLGLSEWHEKSARSYRETQLDDGSWPHRVWPFDGSLAPGWANGRLEAGDDVEYQADQTGSVVSFLASYLAETDGEEAEAVRETLERAFDGMDDTLADDGRPATCQNAWEDASGRFAHTAATFLEAYSALAAADIEGLSERALARAEDVYRAIDDLWVPERGIYALREYGPDADRAGELDERCDSAALALSSAHRTYAEVGEVDERRLDRLVSHVETVTEELYRDPAESDVAGLIRYEGDGWRTRTQDDEKIWTVSTAWGAHAAASLSAHLSDRGDDRAESLAATASELLGHVLPGGSLCLANGYLPEQVFDEGTPDSATPLGWPHALRLATVALMDEYEMIDAGSAATERLPPRRSANVGTPDADD